MAPGERRNLQLQSLIPLIPRALYEAIDASAIQTEGLRPAALAFSDNIRRVDLLASMPALCFYTGLQIGAPAPGPGGILIDNNPDNPRLNQWMLAIQSVAHPFVPGIEAWLASLVTGTWTAFETLAGDLWVAAVNTNPHLLARLAGTEKRIQLQATAVTREHPIATIKQESDMMISIKRIHDITNGKYDLALKMGDLLKSRVAFTRLWDIRRAYSRAFDAAKLDEGVVAGVDGALADKALDALAAVRNVIVAQSKRCRRGIRQEQQVRKQQRYDYSNT
jgi:hypothetical protein